MNSFFYIHKLLFFGVCVSAILTACGAERPLPLLTRVETIAGSNGEFGEPFGIAFKGGEVYVSDGEKDKIVKIDREGRVKEFGWVDLHTPSAIAFDANGDLIVADSGTNSIKAVARDGSVRQIAGSDMSRGAADGDVSNATFNSPVGLAVSGEKIFVSDTYNDRIRVIDRGHVSTLAGSVRGFADGSASTAKFDTPLGLAVWQDKVLIADAGNRRIRVLGPQEGVWTLAGNGDDELRDGPGASAAFVQPTAIAVRKDGRILVADGNAIREISGLVDPQVTTVAGGWLGFADGSLTESRFNRPSGLAFNGDGELLVADAGNRIIRRLTDSDAKRAILSGTPIPPSADEFRSLQPPRWPFDPPDAKRDIAGTMGEIRGEVSAGSESLWFHNGLDIAGAYGETTRFVRAEKVLDPVAAENFGTLRELLRMPTIGYIHLRIGRDKDNKPFDDDRFQFSRDAAGKMAGVRITRGTRFAAGDAVGTLNAMNHIHMIAGQSGSEINALAALALPNAVDTTAPTIETTSVFDENWNTIENKAPDSRIRFAGKLRLVVRAYDRMDGNPVRRKLGIYKLGHQLLHTDGAAVGEVKWTIEFGRMPPGRAVRYVYADGSRSGAKGETIFNYIVTNNLRAEEFSEGFVDASALEPGYYVIRVLVADFFGNTTSKDMPVEVTR